MTLSFNDAIEGVMERGFRVGVAALEPMERTIYVISNADFEINLGGVSAYLYNSAGDDLELLPVAFEAIGCVRLATHAKMLLDAVTAAKCVPSDRQSRYEMMQSRSVMLDQRMDDLERAIQNQEEDYGQMLIEYYNQLIPESGTNNPMNPSGGSGVS